MKLRGGILIIIAHNNIYQPFDNTAAAMPGRIESIMKSLRGYPCFTPARAYLKLAEDYIFQIHSPHHIRTIHQKPNLYQVAVSSVASALQCADLAWKGIHAFAITNPPGHHASQDNAWGFCYFNNMAIAVSYLLKRYCKRIIILDIDMHRGDGTECILRGKNVVYFHPNYPRAEDYVAEVEFFLKQQYGDMLAISAGFDNGRFDWGNLLDARDYYSIGQIARCFSDRNYHGCLFAVLEGGYNQHVVGLHARKLIEGIENK